MQGAARGKPNARLVIAGDNDEAGRKACEKAFIECGVEHILPPNEGQDWNDVWCTKGAEATKKLLQPVNVLDEVIFPDQAIAQTQQTYIIKEWLTENTISVVYGASNVGKAFLQWICHGMSRLIRNGWGARCEAVQCFILLPKAV